jgi:epoxyqueuosine reductase
MKDTSSRHPNGRELRTWHRFRMHGSNRWIFRQNLGKGKAWLILSSLAAIIQPYQQLGSAIIRHMQNRISPSVQDPPAYDELAAKIRTWAHELGFQAAGITDTDLSEAETALLDWLALGFHGEMDYMAKHGIKRSRPAELVPGTLRVISLRMNYMPDCVQDSHRVLQQGGRAFISRYALGRDYHKMLRTRLAKLADRIRHAVAEFEGRVFADSAPVLEVTLASHAGLGWRGKHSLLLSRDQGSQFVLGEIFINLPLPVDVPQKEHCGSCSHCIDICPTQAIVAPYQVDARRCISYLTIELKGSIPFEFRSLIGNRIYGCDDCQLVCPWNRFAQRSVEPDFAVRHGLDDVALVALFAWDEAEFMAKLAGSAIYRIGHEQWLRNIAVALGNAPTSDEIVCALQSRLVHPSELVREHVAWALARQGVL